MSEYAPSTRDIREMFHIGMFSQHKTPARLNLPAFDRWLAAHDAEVRAGVVTEEPEWEYGTRRYVTDGWERGDRYGDGEYVEARSVSDRLHADPSTVTGVRDLTRAVRRRKAGPWVPVKQEGAADA